MSFMEKQVTDKILWVVVEGNCGTMYVPADVPGGEWKHGQAWGADSEEFESRAGLVRDYVESTDIYTIKVSEGFGARLSAPGYLDCTEWSVFNTKAEAEEYLEETYGDDEEEEEES